MLAVARWFVVVCLCISGSFTSAEASAQTTPQPKCFVNGGTTYPGCVPAKMVFRIDGDHETKTFNSIESAILAAINEKIKPRCETMGFTCNEIYREHREYLGVTDTGQCKISPTSANAQLPYYYRSNEPRYFIQYRFQMYSFRSATCRSNGQQYPAFGFYSLGGYPVYGAAICPNSYKPILEFPNQYSGNFGYYCYPPTATPLATTEARYRDSCVDGGRQLCGMAGNPVDLAAGDIKVESYTDMVVAGDFPIEWIRTYRGLGSIYDNIRPWMFLSVKKADIVDGGLSSNSWASISRGDGTQLMFKGQGAAGSRSWAVEWGQVYPQFRFAVKSTLSDWVEGGQVKGVILKNDFGQKEFYTTAGQLYKVENAQGKKHLYTYNAEGLLQKIEQDNGRSLFIEWAQMPAPEGQGSTVIEETVPGVPTVPQNVTYSYYDNVTTRKDMFLLPVVKSISDGDRTVQYQWEGNYSYSYSFMPLLKSVTKADGRRWGYRYNVAGALSYLLSGIIDPSGKTVATYVYKWGGYSVGEEWKGAPDAQPEAKIDYMGFGVNRMSDGLGNSYGYSINNGYMNGYEKDCPLCPGQKALSVSYNANQLVSRLTDFNNVATTFTYDAEGRMATKVEASGTALARTTSYTWVSGYSLPQTVTEPVWVNGSSGQRVTSWAYNSKNQPLSKSVTAPNGAGGNDTRITSYAYNSQDRLSQVTDHQGIVTAIYYNTYGDVIARVENPGTAAERVTRWGGHKADGLARWSINQEGIATLSEWDREGNLLETRQGIISGAPSDLMLGAGTWFPVLSSTGIRQIGYSYNDTGLLQRIDDVDGTYNELVYDQVNRLTAIKRFGLNNALVSTTELTLDRMSNVTAVTLKNSSGQVIEKSGAIYDDQYRVSKLLNAAGEILWSKTFDGMHNPLASVDALQRTTSSQFDALGRAFKQIDADGNAFNVTYGPQDEIASAKDARNVLTSYTYNGFGEMLTLISPDRGTWSFTYDAAGRHISTVDPRGVVVTTAYDGLSRPITRVFSDANVSSGATGFKPGTIAQAFTYDVCANGRGRLCSFADSSGQTAYAYNAWGERTGKAWTAKTGSLGAGVTISTGYGYEASTGRLTAITLPSGKTTSIQYGNDGNISAVSYDGRPVVANVHWTASDKVAGWTWPQSTGWSGTHAQVSFTYDLDGRPVEIEDVDTRNLVWDKADRLIGVGDANEAAANQLYGYDKLDRLVSAEVGAWNAPMVFGYDSVGNRTSVNDGIGGSSWQYTYGLTSNRLVNQASVSSASPTASFASSYDAMGNLINDGIGLSLTYDVTGRLASGSKGASGMNAVYNALGQRVAKASPSETRLYAVDEAGRPLGVYVVDGSQPNGYRVEEEYIHLDGWRPVTVVRPDSVVGMNNPKIFPVLTDHLGTPRKVLDGDTGLVRWSWDAKQPFGHELPNESPAGQDAFTFDLRFPGQRYDEETGLFQNGFRDYHPGLGRYVQSDPLGLSAGWNTYSYVGARPTTSVDYHGLIDMNSFQAMPNKYPDKRCRGRQCAFLQKGTMKTDKGNRFVVYKIVSGADIFKQNCHGYGFGIDYWVEDPIPVYQDEYEIVKTEGEADLILWMEGETPVHTSRVGLINWGKNGAQPVFLDPKFFHTSGRESTFYRRIK